MKQNNVFRFCLIWKSWIVFLMTLSFSSAWSQGITISTSGQTGTSGTNWSVSVNGNLATLSVSTGAASIHPNVITGYLNAGTSVLVLSTSSTAGTRINANIVKSAGGNARLTFKDNGYVFLDSTRTIQSTSNSLDVVLWADADAGQNSTASDYVLLGSGTSILTNGGNLALGGGNDNGSNGGVSNDGIPDQYAYVGQALGNVLSGINLGVKGSVGTVITLQTDGGNISMRGYSTNLNTQSGISTQGNLLINAANGTIFMDGSSTTGNGIEFTVGAQPNIAIVSSSSTTPAITMDGTTSAANKNGLWLANHSVGNVLIQSTSSTGGGILLDGNSTNVTGTGGLVIGRLGSSTQVTQILSASGTIDLRGNSGLAGRNTVHAGEVYIGTRKNATAIQGITPIFSSTSNIVFKSGDFDFDFGSNGLFTNVQTLGSLTFLPYSTTFNGCLQFGGTTSGSTFTGANGVASMKINSLNLLNRLKLGDYSIAGCVQYSASINLNCPFELIGNSITVGGSVATSGSTTNQILIASKSSITNASALSLSTAGADVIISADADNSGSGQIEFTGTTFNITTNGGDITMGGGNLSGTGFARGVNNVKGFGIQLGHAGFESNGGNITIKGRSFVGSANSDPDNMSGVNIGGSNKFIRSGNGKVFIHGISDANRGFNIGLVIGGGSNEIISTNSDTDAIQLLGETNGITILFRSVSLNGLTVLDSVLGGGIQIRGEYIDLNGGCNILAKSGPINLLCDTVTSRINLNGSVFLGSKENTSVSTSNSNISFRTDVPSFSGNVLNVFTSGDFTFTSVSPSGIRSFDFNNFEFGGPSQTINNLRLMNATNDSGWYVSRSLEVNGNLAIYGPLSIVDEDLYLRSNQGNVTLSKSINSAWGKRRNFEIQAPQGTVAIPGSLGTNSNRLESFGVNSPNTIIRQNGTIYAMEDVIFNGNLRVDSALSVYTNDDVHINGNLETRGNIIIDNGANPAGEFSNLVFEGDIISNGGNINLVYPLIHFQGVNGQKVISGNGNVDFRGKTNANVVIATRKNSAPDTLVMNTGTGTFNLIGTFKTSSITSPDTLYKQTNIALTNSELRLNNTSTLIGEAGLSPASWNKARGVLSLTNSAAHSFDFGTDGKEINFDFYRIDSWDNEPLKCSVGTTEVFTQRLSFDANKSAGFQYSPSSASGYSTQITLSSGNGHVTGNSSYGDQKMNVSILTPASLGQNDVLVSANLNEAVGNESWAIANLMIRPKPSIISQSSFVSIPNSAYAINIEPSAGAFTNSFSSSTLGYTHQFGNHVKQVRYSVTAPAGSSITVNGVSVANGQPCQWLNPTSSVSVVITSANGSATRTYSISPSRQLGKIEIVENGGATEGVSWSAYDGVIGSNLPNSTLVKINASDVISKINGRELDLIGNPVTISAKMSSNNANDSLYIKSDGDLVIGDSIILNGTNSSLRLLANRSIYSVSDLSLRCSKDFILSSNADNGNSGAIHMANRLEIVTQGGDINIGGSNTSGTGYATGLLTFPAAFSPAGIFFSNAIQINSNGGDVFLRGRSSFTTTAGTGFRAHGIYLMGDSTKSINSGIGKIYLDGLSQNGGSNAQGIYTTGGLLSLVSNSSDSNAIAIVGKSNATANTATDFRYGLDLGTTRLCATGNGGGIKVEGIMGGTIATEAIQLRGVTDVLASSGPIRLIGSVPLSRLALNQGSLFLGSKAGSLVTTSSSDVVFLFDGNSYSGAYTMPQLATQGGFSWIPVSNSFSQAMTSDLVSYNQNGQTLSSLTWGKSTNNVHFTHQTNSVTVAGAINFYGQTVYVNAGLTSSANGNIFIKSLQPNRSSSELYSIQTTAPILKTGGTGTLTFQANGRILQSSNIVASGTGKLNIVYWSDYNNLNQGGVTMANASNMITTTNGGHIWMGGSNNSNGSSTWNGLSVGDGPSVAHNTFNMNSVEVNGTFNTNGGDVYIWAGNAVNTITGRAALVPVGITNFNTGSGDVTFITSQLNFAFPVTVNSTGTLDIISHQPNFVNVGSELEITGTVNNNIFSGNSEINNLVIQNWNQLGKLKIGKLNGSNILISTPLTFAKELELIGSNIQVNADLSTTDVTSGNITLRGNLTSTTTVGNISVASGRTLNLIQSGNSTYSGVIQGINSKVDKQGIGRLIFTGNHTYTGETRISNGALQVGDGGTFLSDALGSISSSSAIVNLDTFSLGYNQEITIPNAISGSGVVEILGNAKGYNSSPLTASWTTLVSNAKVEEVLERISGANMLGSWAYAGNNDGAAYLKTYHGASQTARFQVQYFNGSVTRGVFVKLRQNGSNVEVAIDQTTPYTFGTAQATGNVLGTDLGTGTGRTYNFPLASNSAATGLNISRIYINNEVRLTGNLSGIGSVLTRLNTVTGTANYTYAQNIRAGLELQQWSNLSGTTIQNNGMLVLNSSTPTTFGLNVSGSGRLVQMGEEVTITGNANPTAGWLISSGKTLTIGTGGTTGMIQGNLDVWGTLKWNRSDSSGISGTIQGPGHVVQMGAGSLTLSGSSVYTGSTTISNGRLIFEADIPAMTTSGIYGSGKCTIQSQSNGFGNLFYAFPPSSTFFVDSNLSELVLGKTSNATNVRIQHPVKVNGNITINATISINAALTSKNGTVTFLSTANTNNQNSPIVSKGLNIRGTGNFSFTNANNDVNYLSVGTNAIRPVFLSFTNANDIAIGDESADGIFVNGLVTVESMNGNVVLKKSILSNNTTSSAVNLIAGKSKAVGDTTGGNVVWNPSVTITTGANGRVNIFSGTISSSPNLLANATDVRLGIDETSNLSATGMNLPTTTSILAFFRQNGKVWYGTTNTNYATTTNWYPNGSVNNNESVVIHKSAIANLNLAQNVQLHQLVFQNSARKVVLGNFNLTATDILGGDASNYIQQSGTGKVSVAISAGENQFIPIGRSSYNPLSINNRGVNSETFTVSVADSATQLPTGRTLKYVNRTWNISKASTTPSLVNFYFQWNPSEVVNGPISNPLLNHLDNGVWKTAYGSGTSSGNNLSHVNYDGGYSPFMITDGNTPLPVALKSFEAACQSGKHVLRWVTATEVNNDRFEIEQSNDGKNWIKAGSVHGLGNSRDELNYQFVVENPLAGLVYYRLRQIDFDGTSMLSFVRQARCNTNSNLQISPNPNRGIFSMGMNVKMEEVVIFNSLGQQVVHQKVTPTSNIELNLEYLTPGAYQIQVKSMNGSWQSSKLIIQ
jgi:autotransporter-associated beta strand protein